METPSCASVAKYAKRLIGRANMPPPPHLYICNSANERSMALVDEKYMKYYELDECLFFFSLVSFKS